MTSPVINPRDGDWGLGVSAKWDVPPGING